MKFLIDLHGRLSASDMGCTPSKLDSAVASNESTSDSAVDAGGRSRRAARASLVLRGSVAVRGLMRSVARPFGYADNLFEPLEPSDMRQDLVTGRSQLKVRVILAPRLVFRNV